MTKLQLDLKLLEKNKNQQFFAHCHRLLHGRITKKASRFFKDPEEIKDQVANFFDFLIRWPEERFLNHANPVGLILTSAQNFFKNEYKKKKKYATAPLEEITLKKDPQLAIDQQLILKEKIKAIYCRIKLLPEAQKQAFTLQIEGYSHKEIGELLQISETASESRINRARRNLFKN